MRSAVFFLIVFLAAGVIAADAPFTIGSASARPGQIAYGTIDVAAGSDAAASIPVIVINGAKTGRVVAFVSGSHGTEYASVVALTRLPSRINPSEMTGTAIVVPLVNVASFEQMTVHTNPIDKKSMNGQYPGDAAGTQTQRVLAALAEQVVKRADVVVDLHGGDLDEDLVSYSYWMRTGNEQLDAPGRDLALAFGLDRIIINDLDLANPASTRSLSGYTLSLGKPVLVAEAGRVGTVESSDVGVLVDGCINVLASLHMLPKAASPAVSHPLWLYGGTRLRASGPGMFVPAVRGGAYVSSGMRVGTMSDYYGRTTSEVIAPIAGLVTFIRGVPSAWKDATLVNIAPIAAEAPPYQKPAQ